MQNRTWCLFTTPIRRSSLSGSWASQAQQHTSTVPGEFAKPAGVAVDQDGNVFVADTWNNRIEEFDADGTFIRTFGEVGDGPGYFARPKGVSIDGDGHVWVADGMQDRVQVYTPEGRLLIYMGEPRPAAGSISKPRQCESRQKQPSPYYGAISGPAAGISVLHGF